MSLDITFTLSDRDLERFKTIVNKARANSNNEQSMAEVEKAAHKIVDVAINSELPDFIAERLLQLKVLLDMMRDEEWQLDDHEKTQIMTALAYFADPIDLIPDHIPGIGFLDDAMFVEIVIRELKSDLECYAEFCEFRNEQEARLESEGVDLTKDRELWLGEKRDELHARIKESRGEPGEDDFIFQLL